MTATVDLESGQLQNFYDNHLTIADNATTNNVSNSQGDSFTNNPIEINYNLKPVVANNPNNGDVPIVDEFTRKSARFSYAMLIFSIGWMCSVGLAIISKGFQNKQFVIICGITLGFGAFMILTLKVVPARVFRPSFNKASAVAINNKKFWRSLYLTLNLRHDLIHHGMAAVTYWVDLRNYGAFLFFVFLLELVIGIYQATLGHINSCWAVTKTMEDTIIGCYVPQVWGTAVMLSFLFLFCWHQSLWHRVAFRQWKKSTVTASDYAVWVESNFSLNDADKTRAFKAVISGWGEVEDVRVYTTTGKHAFVSYSHESMALNAIKKCQNRWMKLCEIDSTIKDSQSCIKLVLAPEPSDIIWNNLQYSNVNKGLRLTLIVVCEMGLVIIGGVIIAFLEWWSSDTDTDGIEYALSTVIFVLNKLLGLAAEYMSVFLKRNTKAEQQSWRMANVFWIELTHTLWSFFISARMATVNNGLFTSYSSSTISVESRRNSYNFVWSFVITSGGVAAIRPWIILPKAKAIEFAVKLITKMTKEESFIGKKVRNVHVQGFKTLPISEGYNEFLLLFFICILVNRFAPFACAIGAGSLIIVMFGVRFNLIYVTGSLPRLGLTIATRCLNITPKLFWVCIGFEAAITLAASPEYMRTYLKGGSILYSPYIIVAIASFPVWGFKHVLTLVRSCWLKEDGDVEMMQGEDVPRSQATTVAQAQGLPFENYEGPLGQTIPL